MITRIALVGASSTGKTTVYEILKNKLPKYEFINESTRTIKEYNLVLDRCYMDVVVYSKFMENLRARTYNYIEDTWNRVKKEYTHYIYFPIEFDSVDDGVRSINETWRKDIDDEFRAVLDGVRKPYLTVTGSPMQRVEQILKFINE